MKERANRLRNRLLQFNRTSFLDRAVLQAMERTTYYRSNRAAGSTESNRGAKLSLKLKMPRSTLQVTERKSILERRRDRKQADQRARCAHRTRLSEAGGTLKNRELRCRGLTESVEDLLGAEKARERASLHRFIAALRRRPASERFSNRDYSMRPDGGSIPDGNYAGLSPPLSERSRTLADLDSPRADIERRRLLSFNDSTSRTRSWVSSLPAPHTIIPAPPTFARASTLTLHTPTTSRFQAPTIPPHTGYVPQRTPPHTMIPIPPAFPRPMIPTFHTPTTMHAQPPTIPPHTGYVPQRTPILIDSIPPIGRPNSMRYHPYPRDPNRRAPNSFVRPLRGFNTMTDDEIEAEARRFRRDDPFPDFY